MRPGAFRPGREAGSLHRLRPNAKHQAPSLMPRPWAGVSLPRLAVR